MSDASIIEDFTKWSNEFGHFDGYPKSSVAWVAWQAAWNAALSHSATEALGQADIRNATLKDAATLIANSAACRTPASYAQDILEMMRASKSPAPYLEPATACEQAYQRDVEKAIRAIKKQAEFIPQLDGCSPESAIDLLAHLYHCMKDGVDVVTIEQIAQPPAPEPVIDAVKVRDEIFASLHVRLKAMRDAGYTYSQYPEIASIVFDGVADALYEIENEMAKEPLPSHPAAPTKLLGDGLRTPCGYTLTNPPIPSNGSVPAAPQQAMSDEEIMIAAEEYSATLSESGIVAMTHDNFNLFVRSLLQKAGASERDAKDARRYRFVRSAWIVKDSFNRWVPRHGIKQAGGGIMWCGVNTESEYDAAVDRQLSALSPKPSTDAKEAG